MSRWVPMVGVLVVAAVVAGCDSGSAVAPTPTPTTAAPIPAGGTLKVAITDDLPVDGWDPVTAPDTTVRTFGPLVMATMLRAAADGSAPTAGLATAAVADATATTWTVTVRPGLTFADGAPLTARDLAFTLTQAAAQPALTGRFGADAKGSFFTSATATDAQTLVVKLRAPNAQLDRTVLAAPEFGCLKTGYGGAKREAYFADPVACGPYIAEKLDADATELVLNRNPAYYAPTQVGATQVVVTELGSRDDAVDFVDGGGDVLLEPRTTEGLADASAVGTPGVTGATPGATSGTTATAPTSSPAGAAVVSSSGTGEVTSLVFRSRPPTRDSNLRIAVQSSIDDAAIVAAQPGAVAASAGLVPPGWPGASTRAVPTPDATLARTAVSLLDSDARSFRLLVKAGDPAAVAQARAIAEQVKVVGITVVVDPASDDRYARTLASGSFEAAIVTSAPRVAVAAGVTLAWAVTNGFGGGWPATGATTAYGPQLSAPAFGTVAGTASAAFTASVLDPVQAIPLSAVPHRAVVDPASVSGLVVRWDGSVPLELVVVAASSTP